MPHFPWMAVAALAAAAQKGGKPNGHAWVAYVAAQKDPR
jgi:hypothetical protein